MSKSKPAGKKSGKNALSEKEDEQSNAEIITGISSAHSWIKARSNFINFRVEFSVLRHLHSSDLRTLAEKRRIAMRRRRRFRSYSHQKIRIKRQNKSSEILLSTLFFPHSDTDQVGSQAGAVRQALVRRDNDRPPHHGECHPRGGVRGRCGSDDKAWSSSVSHWSVSF